MPSEKVLDKRYVDELDRVEGDGDATASKLGITGTTKRIFLAGIMDVPMGRPVA